MRGSRIPSTVLPTSDVLIVERTGIMPLQGRLDRGNQAEFVRQAEAALTVSPYLIVDMTRAELLDSSAFGTLVSLTKRAREAGGELWLAAVPSQVAKVVALLRLDRFFEIRSDVASAFAERRGKVAANVEVKTEVKTESKAEAEVIVIAMPRRLDASTAPAMQEACTAALAPRTRLILDFSQTTFLASAGMAAMIVLHRQAQKIGGELRVACCTGDVLRTLKLTRLDAALSLFADVDAAKK